MKKILFCLMCVLPMSAMAGTVYTEPKTEAIETDFASRHRFYIGGTYDMSWWQNYADSTNLIHGKTENAFDGIIGARISNNFRLEADYMHAVAKWDEFSIKTDSVFFNAIADARINELYNVFYHQHLVPYVGVGAGITWYDTDKVENEMNVSLAALAGMGIELGEYFAFDIGYRYVYMLNPDADAMPKLNPSAHQFRAGVRINF